MEIIKTIEKYQTHVEDLSKLSKEEWITRFPWIGLGDILGGMYAGKTSVVAGRPGMGKSTFINDIRLHTLQQGKRVVSFVLEMGENHLLERMLSSYLGLPIREVIELDYTRNPALLAKANDFLDSLKKYDWHVYGADYTDWPKFEAVALNHLATGITLLDVDYVQLLGNSGFGQNRTQELGEICQRLANWAVTYNAHVMYASQLSRAPEARQDKRPMLADLRDSGGVEQAADIAMLLYRPEYYFPNEYEGIAEVIVPKHRQGSTGVAKLFFDKEKVKFFDLESRQSPSIF